MLKKLMIGAALAAMIGAPAMAQSWQPSVGSGNIVGKYTSPGSGPTMRERANGSGAYAFAPSRHHHRQVRHWEHD